jgi:hypothetical protein
MQPSREYWGNKQRDSIPRLQSKQKHTSKQPVIPAQGAFQNIGQLNLTIGLKKNGLQFCPVARYLEWGRVI